MNIINRRKYSMDLKNFEVGDYIMIVDTTEVERNRAYRLGDILKIVSIRLDCGRCDTLNAGKCPTKGIFSARAKVIIGKNKYALKHDHISLCGATYMKIEN